MLTKPTAMLPIEGNITFRDMPNSYVFPDRGYRLTGRQCESEKSGMKAIEVELPFVRTEKLAYFYIRCIDKPDEAEIIRHLCVMFAAGAFRDVLASTNKKGGTANVWKS